MQWHSWCLGVLVLTETLDSSIYVDYDVHTKTKRAITNNFDILLNIYKMNPLKESNVFKTFSNSILLPRPIGVKPDLNFDSNESTKEKRERTRATFQQIEDAIHATPLSKSFLKRPSLNIQDTVEVNIKESEHDFGFQKQENPFTQVYSKHLSNLHNNNVEQITSIQNLLKTGDLKAYEHRKNSELIFYGKNGRITKDTSKMKDVEVFVMR